MERNPGYSIGVAALVAALMLSAGLGARGQAKQSHGYKLVDLGTLGGPNSYLPALYDAINPVFLTPQALSPDGTFAGWADTSDPNQFAAFKWKDGVRTPLPVLPGPAGLSAASTWISNNGLIAGFSQTGEMDPFLGFLAVHGVLWRNDEIVDLKTFEGGYESLATTVNSRGQVVGFASNNTLDPNSMQGLGTQTRAFLWQSGVMKDLETLGGTDAQAFYINERGQIVGQSYTADAAPAPALGCWPDAPLASHSFLWENGRMTDLSTLGGSCTDAYAVNNKGQVVGQSNLAGDQESHPFLWDRGMLTDLHTLGGFYGYASWLNELGEVVGASTAQGDQALIAFNWKDGVIKNLGTANGDACSVADAINSQGQVVGGSGVPAASSFHACTDPVEHAVLWQDGVILDLNAFVPSGSNLTLNEAVFINDMGVIAGFGTLPLSGGDQHAFLLVPCQGNDDGCEEAHDVVKSDLSQTTAPAIRSLPHGVKGFGWEPSSRSQRRWQAKISGGDSSR